MSFFSKLFKTKPAETLEQRIDKLQDYDESQLSDIAQSSNEPEALRAAAVSKLSTPKPLLKLATSDELTESVRTLARRRIAQLVERDELAFASLQSEIQDSKTLLAICGYSSKAIAPLLAQITDEDVLLQAAKEGSTTQLRQLASQRIENPQTLDKLLKHAKGKDKTVYKIAKSKLDQLKNESARQAQINSEAERMCHHLQQLKTAPPDTVFAAQFQLLCDNWRTVDERVDEQTRQRFANLKAECQALLDSASQKDRQEDERQKIADGARKELADAIEHLREFTNKLLTAKESPEQLKLDFHSAEQRKNDAIHAARQLGSGADKESTAVQRLFSTARDLLHKFEEYGPLPTLVEKLEQSDDQEKAVLQQQIDETVRSAQTLADERSAEVLQNAQAKLNERSELLQAQTRERNQQLKALGELLTKGLRAAHGGQVRRSRAILAEAEATFSKLDKVPTHLHDKFEDLKQGVEKLGDWHAFAVTPKKRALIAEMRSLHNCDLAAIDLADRIHNLQQQWKELCKGGQVQDEELWEAFHSAAQTAYEPCKRHFEAENQQREENEAKRRTLLQQLQEYLKAYDWDNANWPEVEKTLKISRDAWQSYWPIPRKNIKVLQGEFDTVMDALHGKINADYERNRLKKQALVDQAAQLLESQDLPVMVETAKRLQQQWKDVGRCKRKDDRVLWKAFRQHCDTIFERRQQESESFRKTLQENLQQAADIIFQLENIAQLEGEAFFIARSEVSELREAFGQIDSLPRGKADEVNTHLERALKAIESRADSLRQQASRENWQQIFAIADKVRQLELAEKTQQANISEIQDEIEHLDRWPGRTQSILMTRLSNAAADTTPNLQDNEKALRTLCVKAEVANNLNTPAEDKALRMEYQVRELQKGFGVPANAQIDLDQQLTEEWLAVGPVEDDLYHSLYSRFQRSMGWKPANQKVTSKATI